MGQAMDQMKMLNQARKLQKELKNEIVEVEAGDGAVVIQITGELKIFQNSNAGLKAHSAMDMPKLRKLQPTR